MKSYKRFLDKIENFQVRAIDSFQDISVHGNYRFGDVEDLVSLEGFVLLELSDAPPGNVKLKLKKLRDKNSNLMDFDKHYPELCIKSKQNLLHTSDLSKYLPFLEVSTEEEKVITPEYLKTIYNSVLNRQKSVLHLIDKIEDLLVIAHN